MFFKKNIGYYIGKEELNCSMIDKSCCDCPPFRGLCCSASTVQCITFTNLTSCCVTAVVRVTDCYDCRKYSQRIRPLQSGATVGPFCLCLPQEGGGLSLSICNSLCDLILVSNDQILYSDSLSTYSARALQVVIQEVDNIVVTEYPSGCPGTH